MGSWLNDVVTGVGGGLLAGGGQILGSVLTNQANAKEASRNRDFQEDMSNTAHQREVEDLIKAGLNPMLSANAGSSTPGGAQATMENPTEGMMSSAIQAAQLKMAKEKQDAEIRLMNSQTAKANKETQTMKYDANKSDILSNMLDKTKEIFQSGSKKWKEMNDDKNYIERGNKP